MKPYMIAALLLLSGVMFLVGARLNRLDPEPDPKYLPTNCASYAKFL